MIGLRALRLYLFPKSHQPLTVQPMPNYLQVYLSNDFSKPWYKDKWKVYLVAIFSQVISFETKEIHLLKWARNRALILTQILVRRTSLKQNVLYGKGFPLRIYEAASSCSCDGKLQGESSDVQVGAGEPLLLPLQALPPRPRSRLSSIGLYIGRRIVQGQKSCLQVSSRKQLLRWPNI